MALDTKELNQLLELLARTHEQEIDCEACLEQISRFAETRIRGDQFDEMLKNVLQHLSVCADCHEEWQALVRAIGPEASS